MWWLDARAPVVLAEREAVVGYAPAADHLQLVMASNPPQCILERVGAFTVAIDVYAQRHKSERDGGPQAPSPRVPQDATGEADWKCYAHDSPEPATELDWYVTTSEDHPDVSCVVGEGIAAGWWRWHDRWAGCGFVVIQVADDPERLRLQRRDASEPILLTASESVAGYSDGEENFSPFTVSKTWPDCTLQLVEPE